MAMTFCTDASARSGQSVIEKEPVEVVDGKFTPEIKIGRAHV